MIVKLLTEHHLEFLSLKGGCRGSSESTHVKMLHCWKSRALAQLSDCGGKLPLFYLLAVSAVLMAIDEKSLLSPGPGP